MRVKSADCPFEESKVSRFFDGTPKTESRWSEPAHDEEDDAWCGGGSGGGGSDDTSSMSTEISNRMQTATGGTATTRKGG